MKRAENYVLGQEVQKLYLEKCCVVFNDGLFCLKENTGMLYKCEFWSRAERVLCVEREFFFKVAMSVKKFSISCMKRVFFVKWIMFSMFYNPIIKNVISDIKNKQIYLHICYCLLTLYKAVDSNWIHTGKIKITWKQKVHTAQ